MHSRERYGKKAPGNRIHKTGAYENEQQKKMMLVYKRYSRYAKSSAGNMTWRNPIARRRTGAAVVSKERREYGVSFLCDSRLRRFRPVCSFIHQGKLLSSVRIEPENRRLAVYGLDSMPNQSSDTEASPMVLHLPSSIFRGPRFHQLSARAAISSLILPVSIAAISRSISNWRCNAIWNVLRDVCVYK